ncbi:LuxE/PaaK family acyltransferase [Sorangium atrum]|uniref:Acyl-protein synthetase n=1 Tax=Sorangium atrum TaxID=2995308 RepID=A0ABT5C116_9BACT|nr:acyl-protein synthetase [Sorangium aterium]MDC0679358.1 acyl-protein synthetase [Sorangium aterium]
MGPIDQSEALHRRARAFIEASLRVDGAGSTGAGRAAGASPPQDQGERGALPETFDALALALARHQAAHCAPVARLFEARGADVAAMDLAAQIPAVPCDVFRFARVAAHPPEADERVFRTSGTSLGAASRGEHPFRTTATYELAALAWGERLLWPDGARLRAIVLAPPLDEAPDSSLGFMIDRFAARLSGPASWHVRGGELDAAGFARACAEARASGEPALVLGTSFAFVHLIEAKLPEGAALLPEGSRVMQTGGYKGRSREVPAEELRASIARALGVPLSHVVSEYGMTELSSQLYEGTLAAALAGAPRAAPGLYLAPPWTRVTAVDPETLAPLPAGAIGLARIVDLANVDSAVAIQTADRVRVTAEGVELLGRASGAPPRGCSIAMDQMLGGGP